MRSPHLLTSITPRATLVAAIIVAPLGTTAMADDNSDKGDVALAEATVVPSRSHARNLASVCASAQAAGLDFVALGFNDLKLTIKKIVDGAKPSEGSFTDTLFKGDKLTHKEQLAAARHLRIKNGALVYAPAEPSPAEITAAKVAPHEVMAAAREARDRRNAQNLASVCSAAQAAGLDFVAKGNQDAQKTVALIVQGDVVTTGAFEGVQFATPGISVANQAAALQFLRVENGRLTYVAEK